MANYTIVGDCVQGLPQTGTTAPGVGALAAVTVVNTQVGAGYFYKGQVVADTLLGAAPVITRLQGFGAIA